LAASRFVVVALAATLSGCASSSSTRADVVAAPAAEARLAQIYFWRAKPGKLDEYTRYIRERAEPIDEEARRAGAFISVTTFMASDTTVPWTHMRVFLLRDSTQLRGRRAHSAGQRQTSRAKRILGIAPRPGWRHCGRHR
jgi:hypothetical protein